MKTCWICGYPLDADGTCVYQQMDETDGRNHRTGMKLDDPESRIHQEDPDEGAIQNAYDNQFYGDR